jgi:hypothetical protein
MQRAFYSEGSLPSGYMRGEKEERKRDRRGKEEG